MICNYALLERNVRSMNQLTQLRSRPDNLETGIIVLTLITASTHLFLSTLPDEELRTWFLFNGLGYLTLLAAFFLPQLARLHSFIRLILMAYTLLTIILWFFFGSPSEGKLDPFDVVIKLIEAALIVLLLIDSRRNAGRLTKERH